MAENIPEHFGGKKQTKQNKNNNTTKTQETNETQETCEVYSTDQTHTDMNEAFTQKTEFQINKMCKYRSIDLCKKYKQKGWGGGGV